MQVSIKWLKDYIDFKETPEKLADMLTMAGVPVENIIDPGIGLEKVVTGRIEELKPHENSDHLQICTINVGADENIIIVTGAKNVAQGQIVPVAMIGAHLPNGMKISKGKLRGVMSYGMLCSAQELKLDLEALPDDQKTGIYILPPDTLIGMPVKDLLGLNDVILEFELTANRSDCFSVFGLVREIAALTGNKAKWPVITLKENSSDKINDLISIEIADQDLCPRFSCRMLKNIKVGPSPEWMQQRLEGAGIRSINNVVDVTNFVMIELGQPLHAYDYDAIKGHKLIARRSIEGELLHTLDDTSRKAKKDMLVIADTEKAAGLAGIMGGFETEITDKTTTVVLEAAKFYGAGIRRTARSCGLISEASGRFERGTDIENTIRALDRAAQLLTQMDVTCAAVTGVLDVYPEKKKPVTIDFTAEAINKHLGTGLDSRIMVDILRKLEIKTEEKNGIITAFIPSWRGDISCMQDISEEISRIYGFDKIESTLPSGLALQGKQSDKQTFVDKLKNIMVSLGLCETVSFSFTHPSILDKLNVPADHFIRNAIPIMNPLTDEYPLVRTCLLTSVMENLTRNFSRKNNDIKIFEIGSIFLPKALPVTELPSEHLEIAGAISGRRNTFSWSEDNSPADFYDAKGIIEELLQKLSISRCTIEAGEQFAMHPGKTAVFKKGRDTVFTVGELHPSVSSAFGITKPVYIFTADIDILMKYTAKTIKSRPLPKYPSTSRDLAILVDTSVEAGIIEKTITKSAGQYLSSLDLFDVYEGKQIEGSKKSLAFSLTFQANDKTLTDAEIDAAFQNIVEALQKNCNASLRA
ncbi:phenylalanine--tRNA ligase subunit beta [Pectinatus haikarae]|uniref:Phenylalanine--tRNA ligase beta subunit n=1 Tax=Pectinatus haikarae TaxID=349096 RepID=A0ABT9Y957_9FIRM|nr:phenylalanine--tRNA ligase subunit beta [Pectinatus haikarae]MDQ0204380.1 phenylalanyl-tRNA synthetase beta chain [Pectinatus haikarae]